MSEPDLFPGHDGGVWSPMPTRVVASWPVGHFAENLAIDASGAVFISLHSHSRIDRYDPATAATAPFAELPAPVAGLAFDAAGLLWVTGGTPGQAPGYLWSIAPDAAITAWGTLPDAPFLNGCTLHPDGRTLLICESLTGRVLAADLHQPGSWRTWLADDRLMPVDPPTPGANGVKIRDGWAWISVTGRNLLLRAPLQPDGAAGHLDVAAENLRADDFIFGPSGALYIATHPAQTVLRLAPDGTRSTIAGPDQGAVGCTACAFGADVALYVTTNGGLWAPYQGAAQDAKLLRIETGEA
jgi:sugar lactone lactonase YvrE